MLFACLMFPSARTVPTRGLVNDATLMINPPFMSRLDFCDPTTPPCSRKREVGAVSCFADQQTRDIRSSRSLKTTHPPDYSHAEKLYTLLQALHKVFNPPSCMYDAHPPRLAASDGTGRALAAQFGALRGWGGHMRTRHLLGPCLHNEYEPACSGTSINCAVLAM